MTGAFRIDLDQAGSGPLIHPRGKLDPGNDLEMADT